MFKGQRVICKNINSAGSRIPAIFLGMIIGHMILLVIIKAEIMLYTNKLDASKTTCLNKNTDFLNSVSELKQFGMSCYGFQI